jgi:hypothetical protein
MAPSAVGAFLNNIPTLWAVPLAAAIGAVTYELAQFCTNDPPALPTITAADVIAIVSHDDLAAQIAATNKFRDLIGAYYWHDVCQCDTVGTPAPPTPPSAPVGMPNINIGPPTSTTLGNPCFNATSPTAVSNGSFNFGSSFFHPPATHPDSIRYILHQPIPPSYAGPPTNYTVTFSGNGNVPLIQTVQMPLLWDFDITLPVPDAATETRVNGTNTASFATPQGSLQIIWYCPGTAPGLKTGTDCCSDPVMQSQIDQVLQMVTLIQRQIAPFAFIDGATHSGLTGEGTITLTDTRNGIRLALGSLPPSVGSISGNPDAIFEAGYVSLGDVDGWFSTRPIRSSPMTWQPRWMGAVTRIGYSLTPGVTASITELEREP